MTTTSIDTMPAEAMAAHLRERLEQRVSDATVAYGRLTLTVTPQGWVAAARVCKTDLALGCDFFDFLSAVDRASDGFEVVAHLYSTRHRHAVTLRTLAPGGREQPVLDSLVGVYGGANWHEREAYDMFGIDFTGHPGLLPRILTVENFEGWPLRKEFLLTSREAKAWPGAKEPKVEGEDGGDEAPAEQAAPVPGEDKAAAAKAKAERAKAKAAAMRAKKAAERAAAQSGKPAPQTPASQTPESQAAEQQEAEPHTPASQTPDGAADIAATTDAADEELAKDAAAGAVGGDTAAGAPGDRSDSDQPVSDPDAEAALAQGTEPEPARDADDTQAADVNDPAAADDDPREGSA